MARHGIKRLVFSSTAASFGLPEYTPIDEHHRKAPIHPYGRSKWIVEQLLADYESAYRLQSACLRDFNAAGADPAGAQSGSYLGEDDIVRFDDQYGRV